MKSKGISIFTLIFIGILILGIGVGVGYLIPKKVDSAPLPKANVGNTVNTTTNTITNTINTTNTVNTINNNVINAVENTTLTENTIANSENPTEVKKVEEIFRSFAKAVNAKDWATVESYSNANVVSELKKYSVTNMLVGDDTIQENPNVLGGYTCLCSYNIDYNGSSVKDLGMGYIMTAEKVGGDFKISSFYATAP